MSLEAYELRKLIQQSLNSDALSEVSVVTLLQALSSNKEFEIVSEGAEKLGSRALPISSVDFEKLRQHDAGASDSPEIIIRVKEDIDELAKLAGEPVVKMHTNASATFTDDKSVTPNHLREFGYEKALHSTVFRIVFGLGTPWSLCDAILKREKLIGKIPTAEGQPNSSLQPHGGPVVTDKTIHTGPQFLRELQDRVAKEKKEPIK